MLDLDAALTGLRRPALMMRAARFGLAGYQRGRWLRRLVPGETRPERVLSLLLSTEEEMEATRQRGDVTYSVARHLEVLIALLAELRLLRAAIM